MISDDFLSDLERVLSALGLTGAALESALCAAEAYGDARADEALASLPRA
jgi:hypothetical protein